MITKLEEILNQTLKQLNYNYNVKIVKSNIEGTDFQCDDCFKLAKEYHEAPLIIAEKIVKQIKRKPKLSNLLQKHHRRQTRLHQY